MVQVRNKVTSLLFVCLFLLHFSCNTTATSEEIDNERAAYVVKLRTRDIELYNYRVADIAAIKSVAISNRIPGYLTKVHVDEGQAVQAGQMLFSINPDEEVVNLSKQIADLRSSEAEEKVAALEVERLRELVNKDIISPLQLDIAQAKLSALQARGASVRHLIELAELRITYAEVKAPFAGVINRIPYKAGSLLDNGMVLTNLSDISQMYAYFYLPEAEYLRLIRSRNSHSPFDSATRIGLILSDGTPYKQTGSIQVVGSEFENNTGSIAVRAIFPNPHGILKPHASAKVRLPIHLPDVLLVPQKSVLDIQEKKYVYVVQEDRSVKMKPFTYTYIYEDYFVVDDGLSAGDVIIYEGLQHIRKNTRVLAQEVNLDSLWNNRNPERITH